MRAETFTGGTRSVSNSMAPASISCARRSCAARSSLAGTPLANTQQDFNQRVDVAPLASLSYTCASGLGIRGRWFQYSTDGQASTTLNGTQLISPATGRLALLREQVHLEEAVVGVALNLDQVRDAHRRLDL